MAEALKTFFSPDLVKRLARTLTAAAPTFPERAFVRDATRGLDDLELLDRGRHIMKAMRAHLPVERVRAHRLELIFDLLQHAGDAR